MTEPLQALSTTSEDLLRGSPAGKCLEDEADEKEGVVMCEAKAKA